MYGELARVRFCDECWELEFMLAMIVCQVCSWEMEFVADSGADVTKIESPGAKRKVLLLSVGPIFRVLFIFLKNLAYCSVYYE